MLLQSLTVPFRVTLVVVVMGVVVDENQPTVLVHPSLRCRRQQSESESSSITLFDVVVEVAFATLLHFGRQFLSSPTP